MSLRKKMVKKEGGFTLIELLVTITIVAVLFSLALVSLQGARTSARDAKRKADLEEIRSSLEMCRADAGAYPIANIFSTASSHGSFTCSGVTYNMPGDPSSFGYRYVSTDGQAYRLCAHLEGGTGSLTGVCLNACGGTCNYEANQP